MSHMNDVISALILPFQPNAASPVLTDCAFADELDTGGLKRRHDLDERINDAADSPFAGFHPLDGRQGYAGGLSESLLLYPDERSGGPQLHTGDHVQAYPRVNLPPVSMYDHALEIKIKIQSSSLIGQTSDFMSASACCTDRSVAKLGLLT